VFVELFDYTCPHCQRTHEAIQGAKTKLGDRLAIISLPLPLDGKCNPTVPSDYISKNVALYRAAGEGGIPKLMFPQTTINGAVESSETLINLLETHLP